MSVYYNMKIFAVPCQKPSWHIANLLPSNALNFLKHVYRNQQSYNKWSYTKPYIVYLIGLSSKLCFTMALLMREHNDRNNPGG